MSDNRKTITIGAWALLTIASGLAAVVPAVASKPVPKTIVGCVFNRGFVSSDGYDISPRQANGKAVDLRPFEGHKVTISGDLLPGDTLIVSKSPRDGGPCTMTRPVGK